MISTNFFTQYYYAKGVGLILTTSSIGDVQALQSYKVTLFGFQRKAKGGPPSLVLRWSKIGNDCL